MNFTRFLFRSLSRSSNTAAFSKQQRQVITGLKAFSVLTSSTLRKAAIVKVLTV
jgi:hypothetical protein